jgi:hypothetical protein
MLCILPICFTAFSVFNVNALTVMAPHTSSVGQSNNTGERRGLWVVVSFGGGLHYWWLSNGALSTSH